ncbi:hypothetical protein [Cylindrospermum sp. FACHB-282]|uniref:hypothetical protein n=1 Tax=Cylindrospermum sp. FACHB-282 TaxID=2692794 RepID=UPI001685FAB3|nr:hypothetical protein [Cylindrospermum sp. FACHB-282]MBD2385253.1 hypothetical protein [Cylindrospermum sp. FACHB-282]
MTLPVTPVTALERQSSDVTPVTLPVTEVSRLEPLPQTSVTGVTGKTSTRVKISQRIKLNIGV